MSGVDKSLFRETMAGCRRGLFHVGLFSLAINLLMLVPSFYMLQLFDRVLQTRSYATLFYLTLIAVAALAVGVGVHIVDQHNHEPARDWPEALLWNAVARHRPGRRGSTRRTPKPPGFEFRVPSQRFLPPAPPAPSCRGVPCGRPLRCE